MDEIEQKKFDAIRHVVLTCNENWDDYTIAKAILSALKQFDHEPLEVGISERPEFDRRKNNWIVSYKSQAIEYFLTMELALAWCKKKGLMVMG